MQDVQPVLLVSEELTPALLWIDNHNHEGQIMPLSNGQRITLLKIDDCMAMSHRYEMEIRQTLDPQAIGYQGRKTRLAIVRQRGKRKDFYLDLGADDIVLDGWNVPFRTDTEGGVMAGNACYNLVGEADAIRDYIENRAALPVNDSAKAKIIVSRSDQQVQLVSCRMQKGLKIRGFRDRDELGNRCSIP